MKSKQNHSWYEKKLDRRVRISLQKKEDRFAQEHKADTDEQLLDYLHRFAKELGHTPNACEIIGGRLIEKRFGDWNRAVLLAGLSWPQSAPPMQSRLIYRQERKLQEQMFTKERAGSKEEREAARQKRLKRTGCSGRQNWSRTWSGAPITRKIPTISCSIICGVVHSIWDTPRWCGKWKAEVISPSALSIGRWHCILPSCPCPME